MNFLDFEQPIAELEVKIEELQLVGSDAELNLEEEIETLRQKSTKLTEKIYSNLSSWDIVKVARHPLRPYSMDYIPRIFTEFDELHGDRHFADDRAIVGGVARLRRPSPSGWLALNMGAIPLLALSLMTRKATWYLVPALPALALSCVAITACLEDNLAYTGGPGGPTTEASTTEPSTPAF